MGWLLKRIFPILLTWYIKRRMKKGGGASFGQFGPFGFTGGFYGNPFEPQGTGESQERCQKKEEGKVTVVTMEKKEKVIEKDMGEYIDFEEEKQ